MNLQRRTVPASFTMLGEREVEIRMTTGARARDGHILVPAGCELANYRANPIVLWSHDPKEPIGTNDNITVEGDCIVARCTFAPAGISPTADRICGLVKANVVRAVSIGFDILEGEPIDPGKPRDGVRATKWELYENSFVSVPSDVGAVVTARAASDPEWEIGAARNLPIEDSDDWDGAAAEASIFADAGGDDFEPKTARKGFLVYDASKPKARGSYKLPIAHVVDGKMTVPKGAIRAAASRLPDTDIPDDVKTAAGKLLDHYKEKAGMAEDGDRALKRLRERVLVVNPKLKLRGLYECGWLAQMLSMLGSLHGDAVWETEIEADNSKVPAMLGEALQQLGASLIAMTTEEVNELLTGKGLDEVPPVEDDVVIVERAFVLAAKTPALRAWRQGRATCLRAGKILSAVNAAKLGDAQDHLTRGVAKAQDAKDGADKMGEHHEALADLQGRATAAHGKMAEAIEAANGSAPADVAAQIAKVQQHHKKLGGVLDKMGERCAAIGDVQADTSTALASTQRCMRSALRCVRGVTDANTDATDVQTSDGDGDSGGTDNDRFSHDFRRRQAALLELTAA